jgi:hypothetical protein
LLQDIFGQNLKPESDQKRSNHARNERKGYTAPQLVEDRWKSHKKDVYVASLKRQTPAWLIPLVIFLGIIILVFYLAPTVTDKITNLIHPVSTGLVTIDQLYGEETAVVCIPVADLLADDDIKAERIAQALYNEPVERIEEATAYGFTAVRLADGTTGYMFTDQLTTRRDSIEPAGHQYRLIISAASRRVMSHASKGTLVTEVMMGTILFSDYRGDGIYRVHLPGGEWGWISDEGTIVLGVHDVIQPVKELSRYFVSSAMAFHRVTRLQNGISVRGASSAGMAYIAALINGIKIPRTLSGQYMSGNMVQVGKDATTGLSVLTLLKTGDLVFFATANNKSEPDEMGIVMADGQILMSLKGATSIRLINLTQNLDLNRQLIGIRRIAVE